MARIVGDLWPAVSGSASFGVDQSTSTGGFTEEIRPFRNIHMLSGVIHDPIYGSSGVIRFSQGNYIDPILLDIIPGGKYNAIEFSSDGGFSFPIRIGAAPGTTEIPTGFGVIDTNEDASLIIRTSGLDLVSGDNIRIYTWPDDGASDTNPGIAIDSASNLALRTEAPGGTNGNLSLNCGQDGAITIGTVRGDISITSAGLGSNPGNAGGQLRLGAFAGPTSSGRMEYRFGPHQSWYIKTSHSASSGPFGDGFNPLVPSGQIIQMILENQLTSPGGNETLQETYDLGQTIFIDDDQDLQFSAAAHKFRLGTDGGKSEISLSGLLTNADSDLEIGDVNMIVHGQVPENGGTTVPTSEAESQALSLGIGAPVVYTGSGVVNVSIGSGISQFFNTGAQTLSTSATSVNFPEGGNNIRDAHFFSDSNNDILILVPGCYRATYAASVHKTAGTTRQQADAQLSLNGFLIFGSVSSAYVRNATNEDKNTANGVCMFDAEAGDILSMDITLTSSPASNTVQTLTRGCNLVIERIGPKRGLTTISP